jgi:hypothetical protein
MLALSTAVSHSSNLADYDRNIKTCFSKVILSRMPTATLFKISLACSASLLEH